MSLPMCSMASCSVVIFTVECRLQRHGTGMTLEVSRLHQQSILATKSMRMGSLQVKPYSTLTLTWDSAWQALLLVVFIIISIQEHSLVILQHACLVKSQLHEVFQPLRACWIFHSHVCKTICKRPACLIMHSISLVNKSIVLQRDKHTLLAFKHQQRPGVAPDLPCLCAYVTAQP